jgi:hypothetical protein
VFKYGKLPHIRSFFLEDVRSAIRVRHYSIRTEEAYVGWIKRFILFNQKRHPEEMGEAEVGALLSHLTVQGNVAASTQNQALNALLFPKRCLIDRYRVIRASSLNEPSLPT